MSAEELDQLLLRRRQSVYVEGVPADHPTEGRERPGDAGARRAAEGLVALEAELVQRGHLLAAPLRRALAALSPDALAERGRSLLDGVDLLFGADRTHIPLFRGFPDDVPVADARSLYALRVRAFLAASGELPCLVCDVEFRVVPLDPCGHPVCGSCWESWSPRLPGCCPACPVCDQAEADRLAPGAPDTRVPESAADTVPRVLTREASRTRAAREELAALLARRTPLRPQDHDDLLLLLTPEVSGSGPGRLPRDIPLRESKALALAALVAEADDPETLETVLRDRVDTATDVLRLLCVRAGGDPDLLDPPAVRGLPRPLRRLLLGVLDALPFGTLGEDLSRHVEPWKRVAEQLHPFEYARRYPRAALAFAALRGTDVSGGGRLADALLAEAEHHLDHVRLAGDRLRLTTWAAGVEDALAGYDAERAAELLARRPGELLRRLDQLLSRAAAGGETLPDSVLDALVRALPHTAPGPLLGALGALRVRPTGRHGTRPRGPGKRTGGVVDGPRRVFFPRGSVARTHSAPDTRPPLPAGPVADVCGLLEAELVDRLAPRDADARPYDVAVLDAALADLPLPSAERGSSASLVAVPRGSLLPLPGGDGGNTVRLFLHWTQPRGVRVDLDLSVAMFDAEWRFLGLCDYTHLSYESGAAVHSGDLTSAPAPHGATEYVDLDPGRLERAGARNLVVVVFSYNDVAFDELPDAFAGFMDLGAPEERREPAYGKRRTRGTGSRRRERGAERPVRFDPRAVRQRFDLVGGGRVCVPMTVDLTERRARWTDVMLASEGTGHDVWGYSDRLGRLGRDLDGAFANRVTVWDLACWYAAARTRPDAPVLIRTDRGLVTFRRQPDEAVTGFADRLRRRRAPERIMPGARQPGVDEGTHAFCALLHADLPRIPEDVTGTVHRLYPGPTDASGLRRVTVGDLVAELAPRAV